MKFNFFLFLLTALTAVASESQETLPNIIIQSFVNHLFWAVDNTHDVVLDDQPIDWTIDPYKDGNFILPNRISGKSVKYNGPKKPFTNEINKNITLDQEWQIEPVIPDGEESPVYICSIHQPDMCATQHFESGRWTVVAFPKVFPKSGMPPHQWWLLHSEEEE
ncbi:hypothetical protein RclHR1_06160005 [Rhizophagus clarus]|uniref:Ricin B lectin domain-containing protein n=1 Tax=Rhizophagus clarus TaxID=94130 RepID=A0A2Z6RRL4_9GLOM|nr:hypothetical protein RclHR1_06160005 [Rhizophagus clarus]GES99775.1 hypothetical protein GLOIN_2v1669614 [Rhizophagus clarus]